MTTRGTRSFLFALSALALAAIAFAQTTPPTAYTLTLTSRMTTEAVAANAPAVVKVARSGDREAVDITIAAQPGAPGAMHLRRVFDVGLHKVYTQDLLHKSCSWMSYTPDGLVPAYDPHAYPALPASELSRLNADSVDVNGIRARVLETGDEGAKSREWIAVTGNVPVKAEMPGPDGKPLVMVEVKELKYANPTAAALALPTGCPTQAATEWNESGITAHTEAPVETHNQAAVDTKAGEAKDSTQAKPAGTPR
jgi:hypothetical protein